MRIISILTMLAMLSTHLYGADRSGERLSNSDVIDLLKAGLGKELVIDKIKSSDNSFDTSAKAMIALKKADVPDDLIKLMLKQVAMGRSRIRSEIGLLNRDLASDRQGIRDRAFMRLHQLGESAFPLLRVRLSHAIADQRRTTAEVLGRLGDKASIPFIRNLLTDTDAEVRLAAAKSLHTLKDPQVLEIARKFVKGGVSPLDGYLRLLGHFRDRQSYAIIRVRLYEDMNEKTRIQAAWALGEIGIPEGGMALKDALLKDRTLTVRQEAATALGKLANPNTIAALISSCKNDIDARKEVLLAMGSFPARDVVPFLITEALKQNLGKLTSDQLNAALTSLRKLTHQDLGDDVEKWMIWWNKNRANIERIK